MFNTSNVKISLSKTFHEATKQDLSWGFKAGRLLYRVVFSCQEAGSNWLRLDRFIENNETNQRYTCIGQQMNDWKVQN